VVCGFSLSCPEWPEVSRSEEVLKSKVGIDNTGSLSARWQLLGLMMKAATGMKNFGFRDWTNDLLIQPTRADVLSSLTLLVATGM
jgi:hypothetical protein